MARNVRSDAPESEGPVVPMTETVNPHAPPAVQSVSAKTGTPGLPSNAKTTLGEGPGDKTAFTGEGPVVEYKRYRVENGGYLMFAGVRSAIRSGKIVDDRNYDIKRLRAQGFKLTELSADDV